MRPVIRRYAGKTASVVAVLAAGLIAGSQAVPVALASDPMPVTQQNALVQKYCAICHTDASMNGGLSLEHFDAAHPDPGVVAMIVSKLKAKAMGAAGLPLPDKMTQDALLSALSAKAGGASGWTVNRAQSPAPILTASVVEEVPSAANEGEPDLYRLTLTCHVDTHEGEMQLTWSPGVPPTGQVMSAAADGKTPFTYKIEGSEKMGNGQEGVSGPGAFTLYATQKNFGAPKSMMALPAQTLTISNLFPGETVVFPFDSLAQTTRQELSTCFAGSGASR